MNYEDPTSAKSYNIGAPSKTTDPNAPKEKINALKKKRLLSNFLQKMIWTSV